MPDYSLVIPVYNEAANIPELYRRLRMVIDRLETSGEIVLVDDGSSDRTIGLLRDLSQQDRRVGYVSLARNFGHQIAVTAGLQQARGRAVIVLDADLQDPPELIPEMLQLWEDGYQVVYAQRTRRQQEKWIKKLLAFVFYRLLKTLADVDIPTDTGDFCLMDRQVVDLLNSMPERNRYLRGLRSWVGFRQTALLFDREPRFAGEAKYTLAKSLALALNGLASFSQVPLRLSIYLGLFSAALSIGMAGLVLYWRLMTPQSPLNGTATIAIAIFFLGAVQLFSIGILGEYIGRIYEEVKGRPLYTVAEICQSAGD
jgi:polyisoprenyl-phosphate glycosyltransferase